jgi:hypothetical protein
MQKPDVDVQFFTEHPDRKYRIRSPLKQMVIDKQRGSHVIDECELEFRSLGDHKRDRRRIVLCRADHRGNLLPEGKILKVPFLLYADEAVEDDDATLGPIIFELMFSQQEPDVMGF